MAGKKINELMDHWASYQQNPDSDSGHGPPFANAQDLYDTIDSTEIGGVPWQVSTRVVDLHNVILLLTHHGRRFPYNMMAMSVAILLYGRPCPMTCGFETHSRLLKNRSGTRITALRWITVQNASSAVALADGNFQTLCLGIGLGNKQYVLIYTIYSPSPLTTEL